MKQEIKDKWVAALLSGEYQQGHYNLKQNNKFCCLGVLCDIHSKETGTEWFENTYLNNIEDLPQDIIDWSGLEFTDPSVYCDKFKLVKKLSFLNDVYELTFLQIADLIEAQL
jgi:hypothetical protein